MSTPAVDVFAADPNYPLGSDGDVTLSQRFATKYTVNEDGCWVWNHVSNGDRPRIRVAGKLFLANRLSYAMFKGEFENYMLVRQTCENPCCVNPEHLYLETPADFIDEKMKQSKLDEKQVEVIVERLEEGTAYIDIANEFGVHPQTISDIAHGRTWFWVTGIY